MKVRLEMKRHKSVLLLLTIEAALLLLAFAPTYSTSNELRKVHAEYIRNPTAENRKVREETAERLNRTHNFVRTTALILGICNLPVIAVVLVRRKNKS
jgi:hypothetical protein